MHTHDLDINAIRQLILESETDISRLQSHINQTPESHIGELPTDADYEFPTESSS